MILENVANWNFSMENFDTVWSFLVQLGLLLIFLMFGNLLRRVIPLFRKLLVPSALLGGGLLLIVNIICKQICTPTSRGVFLMNKNFFLKQNSYMKKTSDFLSKGEFYPEVRESLKKSAKENRAR